MIYKQDQWSVGHFIQNGNPMVVRARTSIPVKADRETYSHLIVIKWPYTQTQTGMPDPTDHKRIEEFENALEAGTEAKGVAIQALSLTGNGVREWRYYAYDPQKFMETLHEDLQGKEQFPIDLQLFQDPDWSGLTEFSAAKPEQ